MDKPISNTEQNKRKRKVLSKYLLLLAILVVGFFLLRWILAPSASSSSFRMATVERATMENTISASGLVLPSFEQMINSPINGDLKETHFRIGDSVKAGDIILELDADHIQLQYDGLKDELELRKKNVHLLKLQYSKDLKDLDLEDQIMAIKLSRLESVLKDNEKLKQIGGASGEEVQQARMDLQIAKLEKKKLENELLHRKESIKDDTDKLELEVRIQEKRLAELGQKLEKTKVTATQDGVITWVNESIGKKMTEGETLVKIANLERFRVEGKFADLHTGKVQIGQQVRVRVNNTDLAGTIESILPAIENNTVSFNVKLEDDSSPLLRPNMRAEVFIILDRRDNVLRVVNGPAFTGAREQFVFVVMGEKAEKRRVVVGLNNTDFVELKGDIRAGDRIIVSDMQDYDHLDILNLSK